MMKWFNKYDETVQRIHTSSHDEMVKHTSRDILFAKWKKMKWLYLSSSALFFVPPSNDGVQAHFLNPSAAASDVSYLGSSMLIV